MRVQIKSYNIDNNKIMIYGVTKIGDLKGCWISKSEPLLDVLYDVELSLPLIKEGTLRIFQTKEMSAKVTVDYDYVSFRGLCEWIDDDIYVIRFDVNWLEMLEIETVNLKKDDFIEFKVPISSIEIHPIKFD